MLIITDMYYELLVASQTYHGSGTLTYSSDTALRAGRIVKVQLRQQKVLALVLRSTEKPTFAVKPILAVASCPPVPTQHIELLKWLQKYYPAPLGSIVRQFVPPTTSMPAKLDAQEDLNGQSFLEISNRSLPPITTEQDTAMNAINGPGTFVLHGVTGSGKSRIYLELAVRAFSKHQSALILTPEIGLTAQLTATFQQVFSGAIFVLHSQLTAAERRTLYYRILTCKKPSIIIGPRSALFAPLHNIGLIVLDESHDKAYKNESAPHYRTSRVAAKLAALHKATLILGSATPSIDDYYLAQKKARPIITMNELAKSTSVPLTIKLVDMRKPDLFSRNRLLSDALIKHISLAVSKGEQSLIFLNRRGTANVILCSTCGWQALCPNCDLSLTYHGDSHTLRCHICGLSATPFSTCPACDGTDILFRSVGTKAIVEALSKLLPAARIQRFDTDLTKSERLEQQLDKITRGDVDIIVGTQMIGKGLDLPNLSVVGIVQADSSLLIPDYTATEQTYQLLVQVIGRVGRGHRPGTVIVQTYDPTNTTIQAAIHGQWDKFYSSELHERKTYHFPPFVHLLKLRVLRATSKSAENTASSLAENLRASYPNTIIEGPAPSFHPRERGKYSWQILAKSVNRSILIDIISSLPTNWQYDIDPIDLL